MNKKLVALFTVIALLIIGGVAYFLFSTYTVTGAAVNVATLQSASGVTLSVGSHSATVDANGHYTITGIKFSERKVLTVLAKSGYVDHDPITVSYKGRSATQNIAMRPTLVSVINSVNQAEDSSHAGYLWRLMHLDDQATWPDQASYATTMKTVWDYSAKQKDIISGTIISGAIIKLSSWIDPISGTSYQGVFAVPVSYTETVSGKATTKTRIDHYQDASGYFRYFAATSSKVLQSSAAAISAL